MKKEKIGVLITAAGMSKRMGEPKQLKKIGAYTFLQHIVRRFQAAEPDEIVVVTGYMAEETRESLNGYPVTFLHNPDYENTQMFDSVAIGLKYLQDRCDRIFFTPVDVPFFETDTLFLEMAYSEDAVLPICSGRIGHPILLRSAIIPFLLACDSRRGLKGALDELRKDQIRYLPIDDKGSAYDADTPDDAAKLQKMIEEKDHRRAAVFGAGQAGEMVADWLPAETEVVCYLDNDQNKAGTYLNGIPVCRPDEIPEEITLVYLAAVSKERQKQQNLQLRRLGYQGRVIPLSSLKEHFDLRLASLRQCAKMISERNIAGDCAELGVFRGAFAAQISRCFENRHLYLFDTFAGFDENDLQQETEVLQKYPDFTKTSMELVLAGLHQPERARLIKGHFPDSLKDVPDDSRFCFVSLDCDLEVPTYEGLLWFWPRLVKGGMILINDYHSRQFPGVKKACDCFCAERGLYLLPLSDIHGSVILLKQGEGND